ANDVAIRLGHDLLERSTIVAMLVDRSRPRTRNESGAGVDLDFPLLVSGHNVEPHFWMMGTRTGVAPGTPLAWRLSTDAPNDAFELFRGMTIAPGRYWWTTGDVQYQTSSGRPVSAEAIVSTGRFYNGHSSTAELGGTFHGGGHVIVGRTYSVTSARLAAG